MYAAITEFAQIIINQLLKQHEFFPLEDILVAYVRSHFSSLAMTIRTTECLLTFIFDAKRVIRYRYGETLQLFVMKD